MVLHHQKIIKESKIKIETAKLHRQARKTVKDIYIGLGQGLNGTLGDICIKRICCGSDTWERGGGLQRHTFRRGGLI